jgi:rubredoxin
MKCSLCGFEFDESESISSCAGCSLNIGNSCSMVRCPNCGFEMPKETQASKFYKKLKGGNT